MTIIRTSESYFSMPREAARDERLTFQERGVLVYMLSFPDGEPIEVDGIPLNGLKEKGLHRILKKLSRYGYVTLEFEENEAGS